MCSISSIARFLLIAELCLQRIAKEVKQTTSLVEIEHCIHSKKDISHLSFPYFSARSYEVLFAAAVQAEASESTFHAIVTSAETHTVEACAAVSIRNESLVGTLACVHAISRRREKSPYATLECVLRGHIIKNKFIDSVICGLIKAYGLSSHRLVITYRKRRARTMWSFVLAAVFMKKAWRQFVAQSLDPDSTFVNSYLKTRFSRSCAEAALKTV